MKKIKKILFILCSIVLMAACSNPTGSDNKGEHFKLNNWIRVNMDYYYFWNEMVPEKTKGNVTPESFFNSMLEPTDIFSHISDDAETYLNDVQGSSYTAGFSPAFAQFSNSDDVFIVVQYVYPDSPADEAGIKRGDIILKINGQNMNISNYLDLYYADSPSGTVTLGVYDEENNSISEGETIQITKKQMELNPIVYTKIFEDDDTKTGYIFYARFVNGADNKFVDALNDTLTNMLSEGITDLIVDLRYNPGGTINTARAFANALVPLSVTQNEEVFVKFQYNNNLQKEIEEEEGLESERLFIRFNEGPVNLGLDDIYFLTSGSSASASELLINGLTPYQNVVTIGEATYGKFYGAYVIPNEEHNYAIIPVTLKYANAMDVTDFRNGLAPDYQAEEDFILRKPLGDPQDPLLARALELITGEPAPAAKAKTRLPIIPLENPVEIQRGNILFETGYSPLIEQN